MLEPITPTVDLEFYGNSNRTLHYEELLLKFWTCFLKARWTMFIGLFLFRDNLTQASLSNFLL